MWVGTDGLQTALGTYTARLAKAAGVEQEPDRIRAGRFRIHKPAKVEVPVYLSCEPADAWKSRFRLTTSGGSGEPRIDSHDPAAAPGRTEFELMLEADKYRFAAEFGEDTPFVGGEDTQMVYPPEVPILLPISRRVS